MNKEQKEIVKKVNQAYSKLYVLNNIKWTSFRDKLFNMNKQDEKIIEASFNDWQAIIKTLVIFQTAQDYLWFIILPKVF
jgi:hypothetical protein